MYNAQRACFHFTLSLNYAAHNVIVLHVVNTYACKLD